MTLVADIDAACFQTSFNLRRSAEVDGHTLGLYYFDGYREDDAGEPYRKGQLLLSLEEGPGRL